MINSGHTDFHIDNTGRKEKKVKKKKNIQNGEEVCHRTTVPHDNPDKPPHGPEVTNKEKKQTAWNLLPHS